MQKQESSQWWKWLVGAIVVVGLLYLAQEGPEGAPKQPAPRASPVLSPTSSLPDYCWHTPDGIDCDEPSYDERWAEVPDEALYGAEMEEAVREATIEASIDERWDAQWQQEAEAIKRQEEGVRQDALIEEELQWLEGGPAPQDVVQPAASESTSSGQAATLVSVTDGDSIVVDMGGKSYRVRYIGMDTPEFGQYGFDQATEVNRDLLASGPLRLEKDVSDTDQYGRLLRYVFAGEVFVNAQLVRLGYANASTWPPDVKHAPLAGRQRPITTGARMTKGGQSCHGCRLSR